MSKLLQLEANKQSGTQIVTCIQIDNLHKNTKSMNNISEFKGMRQNWERLLILEYTVTQLYSGVTYKKIGNVNYFETVILLETSRSVGLGGFNVAVRSVAVRSLQITVPRRSRLQKSYEKL